MPLLTPQTLTRSTISHTNPILYDNSNAAQGFYPPGQRFFGYEVVPPSNKWSDGTPSFMAPISHYHILQTESFHIASGSGIWFMSGKQIYLKAGQDITIPRFIAHRFENASETEALVIQYRYDAQMYAMERKFFANALTYMWDCKMAGKELSLPQLCIFLADCWMPPDVVWVPGGEYVRCAANTMFMWVLAAIGLFLLGYTRSYPEYYDPFQAEDGDNGWLAKNYPTTD